MKRIKRATALVLFAAVASMQVCAQDSASKFPNRPVTIVIPYPAGGSSDTQVRLISQSLSRILGQPVVIDNKPGASGMIGAAAVARAPADGHTLLFPNNGLLIAPLLTNAPPYRPLDDFQPVTLVTRVPMVLSVSKSVPAATVREFIAYAKSKPGVLNYASAGVGSYGNLASILFAQAAGIKITHIPYKGEAPTTAAVRADEAQMMLTVPSSSMRALVQQGDIKLLGVSSLRPTDVVPEARPIAETLPGFSAEVWFGLLAPAGTPRPIVDKLNAAVKEVLQETRVRAGLFAIGGIAQPSTPEAFADLMRKQYAQFGDAVSKNNLKTE